MTATALKSRPTGSSAEFDLKRDADWKLSVVSGPRNHLYRTPIGLVS
jgi:hypothetical protein